MALCIICSSQNLYQDIVKLQFSLYFYFTRLQVTHTHTHTHTCALKCFKKSIGWCYQDLERRRERERGQAYQLNTELNKQKAASMVRRMIKQKEKEAEKQEKNTVKGLTLSNKRKMPSPENNGALSNHSTSLKLFNVNNLPSNKSVPSNLSIADVQNSYCCL